MPISYTYEQTVQLTDGDWNDDPFGKAQTSEYIELSQTVTFDIDPALLSGPLEWTTTLDLGVIGDFNAAGEVLYVTIDGSPMVTLFDNDTGNDGPFTGDTGPTSIGAQPSQGNVTINGNQGGSSNPFTGADIMDIKTDTAVFFTEGDPAEVTAELGAWDGPLTITYEITPESGPGAGVDFAQIEMDLTVNGDWYGDKAISNVVFYFDCGDDIVKLKIDEWSDLSEEYKSTEMFDFSAENIEDFAAQFCDLDGCELVGMTIKAGRNFEEGYSGREARGEGEIIFGDIEDEYGAQNKIDCEVLAEAVIDEFILV